MSAVVARSKDHGTENFPVASLVLAPAVRAPVLAFYRFVRTADDVADSGELSPEAKLRRLDALETALLAGGADEPAARGLAEAALQTGVGIAEARLMLDAFRQDAVKHRYADWDELIGYCTRSADPVGRFLLRLHREDAATEPLSDALCTALQILNHLQDLAPDRERLDRIYLPVPWLDRAGGEAAFFAPASAALRRPILDEALSRIDELLALAADLPRRIRSARLAIQAAATLACAYSLGGRLRRRDPLASRIELKPLDVAGAVLVAVGRFGLGRFLGRRG